MEDLKKSFLVRGNNIVGFGGSGEENTIESISVNGVNIAPDENKNVDITVPSIDGLTKDADLATVAKSGNYEDLDNKPEIPSIEGLAKTTDIPTKVSQLENDSNYLSSIPEEYITETELNAKGYLTEHQDLSNYATKDEIPTVPSKVSELTNDSNYQTAEQVNSTVTTEIAKVVADAPEDFDTLKEMSDWLTQHDKSAAAMNTSIKKNADDITALQTSKADQQDVDAILEDVGEINSNLTDLKNDIFVNVFADKNNVLKANFSNALYSNGSCSTLYFKCEQNKTYKIIRSVIGKRFSVGLSDGINIGDTVYNLIDNDDNQVKEVELNTGQHLYILVYYFASELDGNIEETLRNSIDIYTTNIGSVVTQINESLEDYGLDNKCSNLVNGYYNADDGSLVTNYNPLRYICSTNSYYLKKGETIRVNCNSVDSIYLAKYDTNGSFINRKDYYDKKDVIYIAQDNIIIKWSVSFSTNTPISQSPHIGVYVNNAIEQTKNDLRGLSIVTENELIENTSKTFRLPHAGQYIVTSGSPWHNDRGFWIGTTANDTGTVLGTSAILSDGIFTVEQCGLDVTITANGSNFVTIIMC